MSLTLQPLLHSRYRRETWTTILLDLFPNGSVTLLRAPAEIDAPHDSIRTTLQLGHLQLADGNRIALVEVEAADTVRLARNRIALRNFIGKLIVPGSSDAVLAVFHQPGQGDWRLTYASRRTTLDPDTLEVIHDETAPRRFTFLLGTGETCRTAAGRLKELEGKDHLTLDHFEQAFSIERLNKDFFKRYKEFYERFAAHLLSAGNLDATRAAFRIPTCEDPKKQDKADKPVRDFAKRLLGRLVFLHFLQKKRWLGCPKDSTDWSGGDEYFIANLFERARADRETLHFHSRYLAPLFFEALNTPDRKGDLFPLTGTRLPYLNGGLFEEDAPALRALDFPPLLFEELLGFFGEYHFTIDENDPENHEVGIDPEMLGHIFENLLEDNKDKGAFYTPKAVVQYMARESLRHYLEAHLGPDPEIALLLEEKDHTRLAKGGFVHQHAKKIATLLEKVKICDPAIGSGAFPIGLLQEILWTRLTLNLELNTPEDRARLKREIIKNSIHGVDLDPGAVEIARLRFWLALVVDEEVPRPLPNLDYKIMQGDALLESFEGIDLSRMASGAQASYTITELIGSQREFALDDAKTQMELQVAARKDKIANLLRDYFSETDPVRKKQRHATIDLEVIHHLDHAIAWERERINGLLDQQNKMLSGKVALSHRWTKKKGEKLAGIYKAELAELEGKAQKLRALQNSNERPFFLWHLYFQDVFENGGFDIVLANPPYVRGDNPEALALRKKVEAATEACGRYETLWEKWDLYIAFIERGYKYLKQGGVLSYIVSDAYCHSKYAIKSQDWFLKNSRVLRLDFLSDIKVFEAAVRNILFLFQKADGANHFPERRRHQKQFGNCVNLPTEIQATASHRIFFLEDEGKKQQMFATKTVPLGDLVYLSVGMVAHAHEKLCKGQFKLEDLVSDTKSENNSKKFVEGKHLQRWIPLTHKWFEWGTTRSPALLRRPTFIEMYSVPEKLLLHRTSGEQLRTSYDNIGLMCNHTVILAVPWKYLMGVRNRSIKKSAQYSDEGKVVRNRTNLEILSEQFGIKYLAAVLNSSPAKMFLREHRRSNTDLYPEDWKNLPIPAISREDQEPIIQLVDQLLQTLKGNPNTNISSLETAIDQKVSDAYGLP